VNLCYTVAEFGKHGTILWHLRSRLMTSDLEKNKTKVQGRRSRKCGFIRHSCGRICLVVLVIEKRRGEQLKWSLAFSLYNGSFPCAQLPGPVHTARLRPSDFAYLAYSLCFVCSFVFFICFYVPILLCFPEQLSHLPYSFWH